MRGSFINYILSLKVTEILGVFAFFMALFQFYWKYKEVKAKDADISITSVSPIQGAIGNVRNGIFKADDKLFIDLLIRNYGGQQVQILYMLLWVNNKNNSRFHQFPLGHSEEFKKGNNEVNNIFGQCLEIIDINPHSAIQKQYQINVCDGGAISHKAKKDAKKAYIVRLPV